MVYDEIRERVSILDVVASYGIELRRTGKQYVSYSPFKAERKPSFYVVPSKRFFKCFATGLGGDVIKFVSLMENITYHEAAIRLCEKYNINTDIKKTSPRNKNNIQSLRQSISTFLNKRLLANKHHPVYRYLSTRLGVEVLDDALSRLRVGYLDSAALDDIERLYGSNVFRMLGLPVSVARSESLIVFPIFEFGEVKTFMFRTINDSADKKYFYSSENKHGLLSTILYNYQRQKDIYLVEGVMDVLAMHAVGIYNSVALLGTVFTRERLNKLLLCDTITLALDSDKAGYLAALRYASALLLNNKLVYMLFHTPYTDPDEAIRNKVYDKDNINEKRQLITTHIRTRPYRTIESEYKYKKWLKDIIIRMTDKTLQSLYFRDFYGKKNKTTVDVAYDHDAIIEEVSRCIDKTHGNYTTSVLLSYYCPPGTSEHFEARRMHLLSRCSLESTSIKDGGIDKLYDATMELIKRNTS